VTTDRRKPEQRAFRPESAAVDEYASWGFYCQGYGSAYRDRMDWKAPPRETRVADLSGYQTLPVNWGPNTADKRAFLESLREITGRGRGEPGERPTWKA
jgi:hypothetical protein